MPIHTCFHLQRYLLHRQVCDDERAAAAQHLAGVGLLEVLEGWCGEEEFPIADFEDVSSLQEGGREDNIPRSKASKSQPILSYNVALCNTNAHSTFGVTFEAPRRVCSVFCRSCEYRITRAGSSVRKSFAWRSGDWGVSRRV
jgi:hypothetical protein